MAPGIEVFGRGAVLVEPEAAPTRARTAWLGAVALLVAIVGAVLTGLGVNSAASGQESAALVLAIGAIGASILSFLVGLTAVVTARGRAFGGLAALLAIVANPWILLHVLEFFSAFVG